MWHDVLSNAVILLRMVLIRKLFLFAGKSFSRVKLLTSNTVSKTTQRVYTRGNNASYHGYSTRMKHIFDQYEDIRLMSYRVDCTKRFGLTFSSAQVHLYPYVVDNNNNEVYPFMNDYHYEEHGENLRSFFLDFKPLFRNGMKEVKSFITNHADITGLSPRQHKLGEAVKTLDKFLQQKEYHEECLSDLVRNTNVSYTELETTALLISHLISPLVSADPKGQLSNYIINNDSKNKISTCPCSKNCGADIIYGNTGFGSEYLWFGKSEIFLYPIGGGSVAIIFRDDTSRQNIEMWNCNESHLRTDKSIQQVVSHAITFSFLQRKYQIERKESSYITSLIPTISATRHYFDIYLYDAENDVLLRNFGSPMPIFEKEDTWSGVENFKNEFNMSSVLRLWMLINHLLLQPELSVNQVGVLRNTCGIRKQIKMLNMMKNVEDSLVIGSTFGPPKMQDELVDAERILVS